MYIDQELCQQCIDCLPACPMAAIKVENKQVIIEEPPLKKSVVGSSSNSA